MKNLITMICLSLVLVYCGGGDDFYQKKLPCLVAKDVISTENYEFSCCLTSDNKVMFFSTHCDTDFANQDIYWSEFKNGRWHKPEPVPFNTDLTECDPALDYTSNTLYFCSNRPGGSGGDDLWKIKWDRGQWGQPVNLGNRINSALDEWGPDISVNGKAMIFSSNGYKGFGKHDLFISYLKNDGWDSPINMGGSVNSTDMDFAPCIVGRMKKVIFASDRDGGYGSVDLWQTRQHRNAWSDPVNCGKLLNSPNWDDSPFLTKNKKFFFFTSINRGNDNTWGDIWMVKK